MSVGPVASPSIPHAEVWADAPSMIGAYQTLVVPEHDTQKMRTLLVTARRRQETSAMRKMWKSLRVSESRKSPIIQKHQTESYGTPPSRNTEPAASSDAQHCEPPVYPVAHHPKSFIQNAVEDSGYRPAQSTGLQSTSASMPRYPRVVYCTPDVQASGEDILAASSDKDQQLSQTPPMSSRAESRASTALTLQSAQPGSKQVNPKFGNFRLPRIHMNTLGAEWWNEIKKRPATRLPYAQPLEARIDKALIDRQVAGRFFVAGSSHTYFLNTIPHKRETYTIHPEFVSEATTCWQRNKKAIDFTLSRPATVPVSLRF